VLRNNANRQSRVSETAAIGDMFLSTYFKVAICNLKDLSLPQHICARFVNLKYQFGTSSWPAYFFLCTFAATFNRSALSRMKPVASSWL
jgi:hypothetical protein